jgi:subtilisin-like proprotein convertase family protein
MKAWRIAICVLAAVVLPVRYAFANKAAELRALESKPWQLADHAGLTRSRLDVNEIEPNDSCPGNPYTENDTFHGSISPQGDVDWLTFSCQEGEAIVIGTDSDDVLPLVDTLIELYADDCATLLSSDDDGGPGLYSLIDGVLAPYTGSYHLKVRAFAPTQVGNYVVLGTFEPPVGPGFCPVTLYVSEEMALGPTAIPDGDPSGGLLLPAITFASQPGFSITDVVAEVGFEHTWVGDVVLRLRNTSSTGEIREADLLNRPGVPQSPFGCSGDAVSSSSLGNYFFGSDLSLVPLGDTNCPSTHLPACYAVAPEDPQGLEIFRGLEVGDGTWELRAFDHAASDSGFVHAWGIHLLIEHPVSVSESTWGEIKASYRK